MASRLLNVGVRCRHFNFSLYMNSFMPNISTILPALLDYNHGLLGDNRCLMSSGVRASEIHSTVSCTESRQDQSVANKNDFSEQNATKSEEQTKKTPWAVRRMRRSLRHLHGLSHETDDSPDSSNHGNSSLSTAIRTSNSYLENDENETMYDTCDTIENVNTSKLEEKYSSFEKKKHAKQYEEVIEAPFGFVRMDKQNNIKRTKGNSHHVPKIPAPVVAADLTNNQETNIFDEEYFGLYTTKDIQQIKHDFRPDDKHARGSISAAVHSNLDDEYEMTGLQSSKDDVPPKPKHDRDVPQASAVNTLPDHDVQNNYFENEYFKGVQDSADNTNGIKPHTKSCTDLPHADDGFDVSSELKHDKTSTTTSKHSNMSKDRSIDDTRTSHKSNMFDEQYFSGATPDELSITSVPNENNSETINVKLKKDDPKETNDFEMQELFTKSKVPKPQELISEDEAKDIHVNVITKQEKRQVSKHKAQLDDPKTAFDMAMKIRLKNRQSNVDKTGMEDFSTVPREAKWTGKTDSHGYRILKNQVVDIQNMPTKVVVSILKDSIVYQDENLLAIDKPYGLPSHGGPGVHNSVGQLLKPLAEMIKSAADVPELQLVHRLDKETTGVMLLAKNSQSQHILRDMFKKKKVLKKYWVLTKGIPNPAEGVIDIPMTEGTVGEKNRMTLSPNYSGENKLMLKTAPSRRQNKTDAITNYKILDSNNSCSLVECQPETGLKHQIRCHMAFALNTPILGDHKYSHYSKIAPQKLYPDILRRLGIRQAKVRHLPMHLHARQVVLPEYKDGRNLFISARLPKHFVQNMKWLKINPSGK